MTVTRAGYYEPGNANKFFEVEEVTVGAEVAERQRVSDPASQALLTQILAAQGGGGAVTITVNGSTLATANPMPITGAVTVGNFPATQPVSGTVSVSNFPASQAVTGPLTDTQLRASAVPVSGPQTDAQARASAQPISGTVAVSNPTTNPETGLAKEATVGNRFAAGKITGAQQVAASGNTTLLTPAAGKKIRLHWIGLSSSQNNGGENLVIIKFANGGASIYRWNMGNPGGFSHWETIEGAVNETLVINCSQAYAIEVNYTYIEV